MRYTVTKHCQKRTPVYGGYDGEGKPRLVRWDADHLYHVHVCIGEFARKADAIDAADGCKFEASVLDNVLLKTVYNNKRDPELLSTEEYRKAGGL